MIDNIGDKCCGCYACYNSCPKKCISMVAKDDGFVYPLIDKKRCISCGLCDKVCPILNKPVEYLFNQAYGANSDKDRNDSSSGGIYPVVARWIINNNGVVYGAAFDKGYQHVMHIRATCFDDLKKTYTSKYMQSHINNIFQLVKEDLESGIDVLFSGTPCQVAGLRSFLKKEYDKLLCVDFICHGVPSEKIWKLYTDKLKHEYNHKIDAVNFRYKENGWNPSLLLLLGENRIIENQDQNIYYKAFLNDLCLRKSCYNCNFKSVNGFSDITLADFWGVEDICPELDDGKGTSLVIVNSEKGQRIFDIIKDDLKYERVDLAKSISRNPARIRSADKNYRRKKYFKIINSENFENLTYKYTRKTLDVQLYKLVLKIFRKIKRTFLK